MRCADVSPIAQKQREDQSILPSILPLTAISDPSVRVRFDRNVTSVSPLILMGE
jgi:hypothetical protein